MGEYDLGAGSTTGGDGSAEFVTPAWLADRLGCTQSNVRYLLTRGRLAGVRVQVGGRREWRVPRRVAEEYVAARALREGTRPAQTDAVVVPLRTAEALLGETPDSSERPRRHTLDVTELRIQLAVARATSEARAELERLKAERDVLAARVAGLEAQLEAVSCAHAGLAELHAALLRHLRGPSAGRDRSSGAEG